MCDFTSLVWLALLFGVGCWVGRKLGQQSQALNSSRGAEGIVAASVSPTVAIGNPGHVQSSAVVVASVPPARPTESGVNIARLVLCALCVAYVLSPIDLVPEALFGPAGLLDDLLAAYAAYQNWKAAFGGGSLPPPGASSSADKSP